MNANKPETPALGFVNEDLLLPDELEEINQNMHLVSYQKNEIIFRQHTPTSHIMFIKSGLIKVYKEGRNKRNFTLKLGTRGEFIGLMSVFGDEMNQYSASAILSAEIGHINLNIFNSVLRKNPTFALAVMKILSVEGLYIFERLMGQSHKQLPGRIADVILYFADTIFGQEVFEFPLTRRELAELAGTTKESFIRTLAEFKNDKIISLDGSKVSINSMKIIRTLSELG